MMIGEKRVDGELTWADLCQIQESEASLTVILKAKHFTAEGMERLAQIARQTPRHRYVVALPMLSVRQGVATWAAKLEKRRNVFIGYVGKGVSKRSLIYRSSQEALDDLTKRATPASTLERR